MKIKTDKNIQILTFLLYSNQTTTISNKYIKKKKNH